MLIRRSCGQGVKYDSRMRLARPSCLVAALFVAGCGGGVTFGFGDFFDDFPPSVSLASAANTVPAGGTVRFIAAASDSDSDIDDVSFFRIDGANATFLGSDRTPPYEWIATAPTDGRTSLTVFARARDRAGNEADSLAVSVTITP